MRIERDVLGSFQAAKVVFEITTENKVVVSKIENRERLGGLLAVIGPANGYHRAVLLEIGIGPSRPYHDGRLPSGKWIQRRRKLFSVSTEQYLAVAPYIFAFLRDETLRRIAGWKCGLQNPFLIPVKRVWWSHHRKKLFEYTTFEPQPRGARFAVSKKDGVLLSDIFWAEQQCVQKKLEGLARFIDKRLKRYRLNGGCRNFLKSKGVGDVKNAMHSGYLSRHLLVSMLDFLPNKRRNIFFAEIAALIGWNGRKTKEQELIESILPEPAARVNGLQLRVITGLEEGKDHIVLEVFSQSPVLGLIREQEFFYLIF